jgi:hypothetical protein
MPESTDSDIDLRTAGIIVVTEHIQGRLITNVQRHLENNDVTQRRTRQIQLNWNEDCEAVMTYFDTVREREREKKRRYNYQQLSLTLGLDHKTLHPNTTRQTVL